MATANLAKPAKVSIDLVVDRLNGLRRESKGRMDTSFWQKQWDAFVTAPLASLIFLALGAASAWWLSRKVSQGTMDALREREAALEERLKLASDRVEAAETVAQELRANLEKLQQPPGHVGLIDIRQTRDTADRAVSAFETWTTQMKEALTVRGDKGIDVVPVVAPRPRRRRDVHIHIHNDDKKK